VKRALLMLCLLGSGCSLLAPTDAELHKNPFCDKNTGHTFCADFETGALTDNWSIEQSAGTVAIDEGALLTTLNVGADQTQAQALHAVTATTSVRVELDMEVERGSDTTTKEVQPLRVTLLPAPSGYDALSASLDWTNQGPMLELESQVTGAPPITPQTAIDGSLASWHHVIFDWDLPGGMVKLTLDGTVAATANAPHVTAKSAQLRLGAAHVSGVTSAWQIRHDNVLVDAQ
jgi:hypothetical protein